MAQIRARHGARSLGRIVLAAAAIGTLGACARIEPRVWQNGQAMSSSYYHTRALQGDHSFNNMRRLYQTANPRSVMYGTPKLYTPFTHWEY